MKTEYIPKSQLIKYDEIYIIRKLPLPDDAIDLILKYYDFYLNPEDSIDNFWIKLGRETCNLAHWAWYCVLILEYSFGRSHKYSKIMYFKELFANLISKLDDLVCGYYPYCQDFIYINSNLTREQIRITDVFYRNLSIIEYPILYNYNKKCKKTLTIDQKKYILEFINRFNYYLNYIEYILYKLPMNINNNIFSSNYVVIIHSKKKEIFRTLLIKLKKKLKKLNIINDIKIE